MAELARLGYVVDRNLVIDRHFSKTGIAGLDAEAGAVSGLRPDLIVAVGGTSVALAAKKATTTIPIVFSSANDPVGAGLVASLARPGGNVTGLAIRGAETAAKALQYLAEAVGTLRKMAYFHLVGAQSLPWYADLTTALVSAGSTLGTEVTFFDIGTFADIEPLLQRLAKDGFNGVSFIGGLPPGLAEEERRRLPALYLKYRLPSTGDTEYGSLLSYGVPDELIGRTAARYVDRVLKGTRPSELPVEQINGGQLAINMTTANALGLRIPQSLLVVANVVR